MKTMLMLLTAGSLAFSVSAQTTPGTTPKTPGTTPTTTPGSTPSTQQPTTQKGTQDPVMMDENTARTLGLTQEQMAGWKERGTLYDREYRSLKQGSTYEQDRKAWMERRDKDLKGYLTPEQYENWSRMNNGTMPRNTTGTRTNDTPPTPAPSQPKR